MKTEEKPGIMQSYVNLHRSGTFYILNYAALFMLFNHFSVGERVSKLFLNPPAIVSTMELEGRMYKIDPDKKARELLKLRGYCSDGNYLPHSCEEECKGLIPSNLVDNVDYTLVGRLKELDNYALRKKAMQIQEIDRLINDNQAKESYHNLLKIGINAFGAWLSYIGLGLALFKKKISGSDD